MSSDSAHKKSRFGIQFLFVGLCASLLFIDTIISSETVEALAGGAEYTGVDEEGNPLPPGLTEEEADQYEEDREDAVEAWEDYFHPEKPRIKIRIDLPGIPGIPQ